MAHHKKKRRHGKPSVKQLIVRERYLEHTATKGKTEKRLEKQISQMLGKPYLGTR